MELKTERLLIRGWRDSDLVPFQKMNADPKVMEFFPGVLSAAQSDEVATRIKAHIEKHGFGLFAVELVESNEFIGFVGLQWVPFEAHFTPAVEIGWRIASAHWNKGYATEAAGRVLRFAFDDLKLEEVVAMTYVGNLPSRKVMDKLGMTRDLQDDFDNPHPYLVGSHLKPHVLYRKIPE